MTKRLRILIVALGALCIFSLANFEATAKEIKWVTGTPQYAMFKILSDATKVSAQDAFLMQGCTETYKNNTDDFDYDARCSVAIRERGVANDIITYISKSKYPDLSLAKAILLGKVNLNNGVYNLSIDFEKENSTETTCILGGYETNNYFRLKKIQNVYMLEKIETEGH